MLLCWWLLARDPSGPEEFSACNGGQVGGDTNSPQHDVIHHERRKRLVRQDLTLAGLVIWLQRMLASHSQYKQAYAGAKNTCACNMFPKQPAWNTDYASKFNMWRNLLGLYVC